MLRFILMAAVALPSTVAAGTDFAKVAASCGAGNTKDCAKLAKAARTSKTGLVQVAHSKNGEVARAAVARLSDPVSLVDAIESVCPLSALDRLTQSFAPLSDADRARLEPLRKPSGTLRGRVANALAAGETPEQWPRIHLDRGLLAGFPKPATANVSGRLEDYDWMSGDARLPPGRWQFQFRFSSGGTEPMSFQFVSAELKAGECYAANSNAAANKWSPTVVPAVCPTR
jgi:hypothetical protein